MVLVKLALVLDHLADIAETKEVGSAFSEVSDKFQELREVGIVDCAADGVEIPLIFEVRLHLGVHFSVVLMGDLREGVWRSSATIDSLTFFLGFFFRALADAISLIRLFPFSL